MTRYFNVLFTVLFFCVKSQTWQSLGPNGGYFKDFAFHPTNSQIVFAGSDDSGGLWKTVNGGSTWTIVSSAFPNFTGWKIVFDHQNANKIYACDMYGRYGLIKSTDGGNTWQLKNTGLSSKFDKMVTGLAIAYNKPDTLLICTGYEPGGTPPRPGNGVFKSYNGGNTWLPAGLQGTTTPCIASNGPGGAIMVGTIGNGLKVTTDYGTTWVNHPQIPLTANIYEIETDSNIVMVSALVDGVYLSTDYGNNFTNIGLINEVNFDINVLKKTPTIELFSSTFSGLKKYSSVTASWTPVNHPDLVNQLTMGIASKNNEVYLSNFNNNNILKSIDGGITWNYLNQSPKATEIGGLYIDPTNSNHLITSLLGTYNVNNLQGTEAIRESTDGGITWTKKGPVAHGRGIARDPNNSSTFYLGTHAKGLYKTNDAFTTYTNVRSGNKVILDVVVNPNNAQEVLISEIDVTNSVMSILKSNDGGINFSMTSTLVATKLDYEASSPSVVYASTYSGLFKSTDGGSTWTTHALANTPLSTVKSYSNHIYTAHLNGTLYKISGSSTVNITGPWPANSQISNIVEHNGKLVIGINGAEKDTTLNLFGSTYLSTDQGLSWMNITGNMPCTHVYAVNGLQAFGNDLYVGTYGGGIFKSAGMMMNTIELNNRSEHPIVAFPNPANNLIQFTQEISVRIFNINGKLIYSGTTKELNTSLWENGIYFAQSQNSSFKFVIAH